MKIAKIKRNSNVLLSILVISVFMIFISVSVSYKEFKSAIVSGKLVSYSHKTIQPLLELHSYIQVADAAQNSYILTKDVDYIESYMVSIRKLRLSINYLEALTKSDIVHQKNIDTLRQLINERFDIRQAPLQEASVKLSFSTINKAMILSHKNIMDKITSKVDEIKETEKLKLKIKESDYLDNVKISPITFLYTTFFSLLIFSVAFYKIFNDINILKNANNELLINKELFNHNESIAKISSWYWNIDEKKLVYSDNQYRLLGCEPNEFEPSIANYLKFVHVEDRHLITDGEEKIYKKSQTGITNFRVIRKDGEIRHFKSLGKIITDTFGHSIAIGINADITEEHVANKFLEDKLFDLERTNKELLAFNYVASHDLQEPLRKIQTFISRIDEKESETLTDNGKKYFSRIKISANRMQILIDDLLSFSRANKAEKAFEITDLNLLLENSKQELGQLIKEKKAIVNYSKLPTISIIPFQIQQLFTNLISNSLKYSKADVPPVITIQSEIVCGKDILKSSFIDDYRMYKISISDNGIGFNQQYAEEIFTLFNRLHNSSEFSGTGIGLAICKKIAENHKGLITAESTPDKGATFTIFLPILS